ncbi:MAG: class I SAM-dependent methyltransferase [Cyanobacteriota bacterium]
MEQFYSLAEFQRYIQASFSTWARQVQQTLRLIALNGITEPLSGEHIAAADLIMANGNYRETLEARGWLARHRAVMLVVESLLAGGFLPPRERVEVYCPEAVTAFSDRLRGLFPRFYGSEFMPDPNHPLRSSVPHQDLCSLTLPDDSADLVIANEVFEHLYNLPAALGEIARILRPGGYFTGTFPFAYDRYTTIIKVRHREGASPGVAAEEELLTEPEFHGNPVDPELGSLVYQIPGWDLLDQARAAGLSDACIHWIASPSHGVVGQETPGLMVLVAKKA